MEIMGPSLARGLLGGQTCGIHSMQSREFNVTTRTCYATSCLLSLHYASQAYIRSPRRLPSLVPLCCVSDYRFPIVYILAKCLLEHYKFQSDQIKDVFITIPHSQKKQLFHINAAPGMNSYAPNNDTICLTWEDTSFLSSFTATLSF